MFDLEPCLRGEKSAWDAFVDRFGRAIYAAVSRTLRLRRSSCDDSTIQDVAQDVFVRLVKNDYRLLRTYDPSRAALTTWLTIVSRSVAMDHLRRRRLPTVSIDDAPPGADPSAAPPPDAPEPVRIPPHLLSPRQRLVLTMLFDEEKTVAETAEMPRVNAQTVRSTKHKALIKLRAHFNDREAEP